MLRRLPLALLVAGLAFPAAAQPGFDPTREMWRGALLFHGNYCGPGSRGGQPTDELDMACMHHDACAPAAASGALPRCGCNRRLVAEAARVARDPRQPSDLRSTAENVSDSARLLPCR